MNSRKSLQDNQFMDTQNQRIYLSSPHMGGEELGFIEEAFRTNWISPLGANVDGFEQDLEHVTGRKYAAAVSSGTSAIHLALILCGVKAGDEVICQSFTFAATVNPVRYQGAIPVLVDSEPRTWNMDPSALEAAIVDRIKRGKKPKAIIVVHLYGMPAQMDELLSIAAQYDIPVIEDAAEALGSKLNNRNCGNFGSFSVLSFNGNKIITTSGGGALLCDERDHITEARFLATQARDEAPHYQHSKLGYNYRLSNISAGIGRGQMKVLDQRVTARRQNHDFYFKALNGQWANTALPKNVHTLDTIFSGSGSGFYFLKEPAGYYSNRWLTTILVNPKETGGVDREAIRLALEAENIESRPLWKPMHLQPLYQDFTYYGNGLSEWLFKHGLCLPSGSNLSAKERDKVVATISSVLSGKEVPSL